MNSGGKLAFSLSGGFLLAFVVTALIDIELLSSSVNTAYAWSVRYFGAYWQIFALANFFIAVFVALSPAGKTKIGSLAVPEMPTFKWFSVILCTLLAAGGVFFAAAEPMAHFVSAPPLFEGRASVERIAHNALAQTYFHWGYLSWAMYGGMATMVLAHLHYDKGLPLKPRTLLYPLLGRWVMDSWFGSLIDAACIVAVAAGTVGPIGFLGLQVSYGLAALFGTADVYLTQSMIIVFLIGVYTLSTVSGIHRGIQLLSTFNVILALCLMGFILLFGPTQFILKGFVNANVIEVSQLVPMALFRGDDAWLSTWSLFFFGWFVGYAPLMAMFVVRISNGRSIRQMIIAISVFAPIATSFWISIVGGTGLAMEIAEAGVISKPFEGFNMPAALLAITQNLPFGFIVSILFLILTTIFVATTGDSMTYTISMVLSGSDDPPRAVRIFWGVMLGVLAIILLKLGSGGIAALQSFIVITAVPVSIIVLPTLWYGVVLARTLGRDQ